MSHELRTPLNSLLILSKLLADNPQGNLNEKQTEFARTINSAGSDLLSLINDILDLSKIESGTVSIEVGDMPMRGLKQHMDRTFRQLAADKGLEFNVDFDANLPATIRTDEKRLQQVVLNLLSNAFKFTGHGGVTLNVRTATQGWSTNHPVLRGSERAIEIAVTDTGIGIPEDKQKLIFEAFQQADGTTSRKYGGTGLGLSISREIARLLGGELQVRSRPGEGSTFTLFVPLQAVAARSDVVPSGTPARYENSGALVPTAVPLDYQVSDDRDALGNDPFVLIVEDDPTFASILLDLAREAGLKGVVSTAGAGTLSMARKMQPDAITLDLGLSDIDGFVLLDLLKHDPQTAGLPIHVISGASEVTSVTGMGAFGVTEKPAERDALSKVFGISRGRSARRHGGRRGSKRPTTSALRRAAFRSLPARRS
jgi:CheY-like chemotaxis protein